MRASWVWLVFGVWSVSSSAWAAPKAKAPKAKVTVTKASKAPSVDSVAALGRGYTSFVDGDYAAARAILAKVDLQTLHNRDYALYLLAQAELLDGAPAKARKHFAELGAFGNRFQTLARWRMADCDYAAGKLDEARRAYETMLGGCNGKCDPSVDPAVALFRIGEAHRAKKATSAAQQFFRRVYVEKPHHPLAAPALEQLQQLKAPPITVAEHLSRAKTLTANRLWPVALEELGALATVEAPALRDEIDYWYGTTKFKMRRDYDVAAQKLLGVWQRLPGDERRAEALFHGARAWSRADRDDDAIVNYQLLLKKFPGCRFAAEASFLIGWLDFNRGRFATAIPALEETLRRFGSSAFGDDARWYLGLSRWLSGDTAGALADFQKLGQMRGALVGGKGLYWTGRALAKLGRTDEAVAVWKRLPAEWPLGYYATMARARIREAGTEPPPPLAATKGNFPSLGDPDEKLAGDPVILRVDELAKAGLSVEAGSELARAEPELIKRLGSSRALPLLFDRYRRGVNFFRVHRLSEAWAQRALLVDPHADPAARRWWEQVYPLAYRELVEKYAPTGENPPYYLYTIMQKESAYNPHDVSYADAIGLLQMIPPTSRRVASKIGREYTDDVLYDPDGNVAFGAWYIGHLLKKFKGQIPIGAGSFNSGPRAMMRWLKRDGTRPLDELIELCSYTQTREYMKKVVDIYAHYVWLYAHQDWAPSMTVDPVPLDDGVDY